MKMRWRWRLGAGLLGAGWLLLAAVAYGQAALTASRPLAFEVVSLRESKPGGGHAQSGPTADGFRMANEPLLSAILTAYVPSPGGPMRFGVSAIQGVPDWTRSVDYDIDAKVAEQDLAEWQRPSAQASMLPVMLQTLLAERCKLAVHREWKEAPVFRLTVAKGGVKMKPSKEGDVYPPGYPLPGGGVQGPDGSSGIQLYGVTMGVLAVFLSNVSGRPVQDATGLTGKYDFTLQRPAMGVSADDTRPPLSEVMEDLGLKLEGAKGKVEVLVVDHVERPSAN